MSLWIPSGKGPEHHKGYIYITERGVRVKIGIIGAGKVGSAIGRAMREKGLQVLAISTSGRNPWIRPEDSSGWTVSTRRATGMWWKGAT